ncbi:MAG: hypothetical protein BZ133_02520 [Methanosphaera sp. SHI613]|jgi:hypothetical protein|nr:MAG: hypothetical protein BZ133_02520 [Methanosphaera sp. SHI613]
MSARDELLDSIRQLPTVIIAEFMDDEMKKRVLEFEMKRLDELVPFINKGMEEAFQLDEAIVVVIDNSVKSKHIENSYNTNDTTFTLRTESGKIIGESIYDEEELEDLRDDPNVTFLSDNFVTYNDMSCYGERQFFVMSSTTSNFFTDADLESIVSKLTVAVPSTETDHYIRNCFNLEHDAEIGSLIIGFTE